MTERQAGYIHMAEQSIISSKHMLEQNDYPGFIVSRCYYSMFYCASALLEGIGARFSNHGQAIGSFVREFIRTDKLPARLQAHIKEAFDLRSSGDYDPAGGVVVEDARENIARSEEFLAETKSYLNKAI